MTLINAARNISNKVKSSALAYVFQLLFLKLNAFCLVTQTPNKSIRIYLMGYNTLDFGEGIKSKRPFTFKKMKTPVMSVIPKTKSPGVEYLRISLRFIFVNIEIIYSFKLKMLAPKVTAC